MHHDIQLFAEYAVTPFVGVWIETWCPSWRCPWCCVTPFVGVWIETLADYGSIDDLLSHPSWVCGLKLVNTCQMICNVMSHPSWVCGLKQQTFAHAATVQGSHPSWVCGLKPLVVCINQKHLCHTLRGCVD